MKCSCYLIESKQGNFITLLFLFVNQWPLQFFILIILFAFLLSMVDAWKTYPISLAHNSSTLESNSPWELETEILEMNETYHFHKTKKASHENSLIKW